MAQEVEQAGELEALSALDEARAALKEVRHSTADKIMKDLRKKCQRTDELSSSQTDINEVDNGENASNSHATKSEEELIALAKVVEANLSSEHHEKTISVLSMPERRVPSEPASTNAESTSPSSTMKNELETSSTQTPVPQRKRWYVVKKFFTKMKSNKNS